jgi:hypothetical protein
MRKAGLALGTQSGWRLRASVWSQIARVKVPAGALPVSLATILTSALQCPGPEKQEKGVTRETTGRA